MRTPRRFAVRLCLAAAVAAAPLPLSACDAVAEKAVEEGIEQAAEEDGQDVEVDLDDDGGIKVEGSDGTFEVGEDAELPADWPEEIPVLDGEILGASSGAGTGEEGWYVTMTVPGSAAEVFASAGQELEDAGFSQDGEVYGTLGGWTDETWDVVVTVGEADGEASVQYVVSPAV